MIQEEFIIIKEIIDKEIDNKNLDDLLKIKDYMNKKIYSIKEDKTNKNYDILLLDLMEFINTYITPEKNRFNRYSVYQAIRKIQNKEKLRVLDSVGIGSKKLLKYKNIGNYTVDKYEKVLNDFGYSLDKKLTAKEKQLLKIYKLEKLNK